MPNYFNPPRPPVDAVQEPNRPKEKVTAPNLQAAGFSPLLTALLGMTIKDGLVNHTAFSLLRDIFPYVSKQDQTIISQLIGYQNMAGEVLKHPYFPPLETVQQKRPLTNRQKFLELLRAMRKYGGQNANASFAMLERVLNMQQRMTHLSNKGNHMAQALEMMSLFGGQNNEMAGNMKEMSNMANLFSMMNAMGNMGGGGGKGMDMASMAQLFSAMQKK